MMTNRELKEALGELSELDLDKTAAVRIDDEYFGIVECDFSDSDDDAPFDEPHPILVIN